MNRSRVAAQRMRPAGSAVEKRCGTDEGNVSATNARYYLLISSTQYWLAMANSAGCHALVGGGAELNFEFSSFGVERVPGKASDKQFRVFHSLTPVLLRVWI
eukprot:6185925-Pleurochrysis_carterae.AAC.3